jgi:hypothetical protein
MLLSVAASTRRPDDTSALSVLLKVAQEKDFDAASAAMLEKILANNPPSDAIMLAGIAHSSGMITILKTMPIEGRRGVYVKMALARAGDTKSSETILMDYKESTLQERMMQITRLSYMRTPETMGLLKDYLSSSEEIPTQGDMIGSKLSHLALIELRKFVKDLPPGEKRLLYSVTEKDIESAIQWLKDHPNPEIIK